MQIYLTVDRCPEHRLAAICVNLGDTGTRLTPMKCCGRWSQEVFRWSATPDHLREMAETLQDYAERAEQ